MKPIDLRSDTVTRPGEAMRQAMVRAEVGDDGYGEDPSVNRLEALAAEMIGTEAAVYAPSGIQSNLMALLSHCERGDEYIAGQEAHTYKYEGGGAAVLGSIQPQPIEFERDGSLDLEKVARAIKPVALNLARTRLLCLENTQAGRVLPLDYIRRAAAFTRRHALGLHLDGARVFNAAVRLGVPVQEITRHFDSVSVCLSKGLGAPVGSVLCGPADLVARARRWRKILGGAMRQAGMMATGGIFALTHNVQRLAQDHEHARLLAQGLARIDGLRIDVQQVQTNMVFVASERIAPQALCERLRERGIWIKPANPMRLVTHLDVDAQDVDAVIAAVGDICARPAG